MKPTGTLTAVPNPIPTTDPAGVGVTTLSWTFGGTDVVEVRVGAPDGPVLSRSTSADSATTGKWVTDGTVFYLQDVSGGAPQSPENTLASVAVSALSPATRMGASVLILMYHRVAEISPDPWSLCVKPGNFAEHLEVLRDKAQVLSLGELVTRLDQGRLPERSVVVTFDDGYADNLYEAKPLLERFGIPATFFVTSGYIGQDREFWWDELEQSTLRGKPDRMALYLRLHQMLLPLGETERRSLLGQLWEWVDARPEMRPSHRLLSLNDLAVLGSCELIDIGAHTLTHALLPKVPEGEQRREILAGKVRLEEILGRPIRHFAYPFGRYDETTIDIVKRGGFACACTTIPAGVNPFTDPFQLPRLAVEDWTGEEFYKGLSARFRTDIRRTSALIAGAGRQNQDPSPGAGQRGEGLAGSPEALAKHLRQAEDVRKEV